MVEVVTRSLLHGAMLGALDSMWGRERDEPVPLETFRAWQNDRAPILMEAGDVLETAPADHPFARLTYDKALELFQRRKVMNRETFDKLGEGMKRHAFTVAGLARDDLLEEAHGELTRMLADSPHPYGGPNLRDFQQFCEERLESSGWTPANPTHVENVYRTNIASAYASGGFVEMRQPEVLAARPYWQIRGVGDSRQRPTHAAVNGLVLHADDPAWQKAYPPFGYMCRCSVVSRSQYWVTKNGVSIATGLPGLPDPGFDSGTSALPGAEDAADTQEQTAPAADPPAQGQPTRRPSPALGPPLVHPNPPQPGELLVGPPPPETSGAGADPTTTGGGGNMPPEDPPPPPGQPPGDPPGRRPRGKPAEFKKLSIKVSGGFERVAEHSERVLGEFHPDTIDRLVGARGVIPGLEPSTIVGVTDDGHLRIDAELTRRMGTIQRSYRREDGILVCYNGLLGLEETLQNTPSHYGIQMVRVQMKENLRLGVQRVEMDAALVGRYSWPRMGYQMASRSEWMTLQQSFASWLEGKRLDPAAAAGCENVAAVATYHAGAEHTGKEFLLQYKGPMALELDLTPGCKQRKYMEAYLYGNR